MQSNAGSTRRVRYLLAAVAGFVFSILAIFVSFWGTYYSSPRMLSEKNFEIYVVGDANVTLPLAKATGEKIYYELQLESSSNVSASLLVSTIDGSQKSLYLGDGSRFRREGVIYLKSVPLQLSLIFRCNECTVRGLLSIRYFSVDYSLLLAINILAVASSLIGIGLLAVGCYGYMIERRTKG